MVRVLQNKMARLQTLIIRVWKILLVSKVLPDGRWDDLSLKHAYVGAIAGRANKSIEFDWGNHGSAQWLAINTRSVSNTEVPVPPKNGEFEIDFHKNTVTAAPVNVNM